jgi:soluble lytic murein transglycosylase-like protein
MQLMPGTAARYGVTNPYDPAQNIMGGTHYLSDLLRLFRGRVDLALAGYNAGEGAVMKYGNRIPPYAETQNYVRTIGARYTQNTGVTLTGKTSARKEQGKGK